MDIPESAKQDVQPVAYDPGMLNEYGGGDVNWWFEYIRLVLTSAHTYYVENTEAIADAAAEKAYRQGKEDERHRILALFDDRVSDFEVVRGGKRDRRVAVAMAWSDWQALKEKADG